MGFKNSFGFSRLLPTNFFSFCRFSTYEASSLSLLLLKYSHSSFTNYSKRTGEGFRNSLGSNTPDMSELMKFEP